MVVVAVRFGRVEVFSGIELDCVVAVAPAVVLLVRPLRAGRLTDFLTDFLAFPRGITTETNELSFHVSR